MVMTEGALRQWTRARQAHRLGDNDAGQASFAVIAVILLIGTVLTGTYMAKDQLDDIGDRKRDRILDAMEDALRDVVEELGLCAASRAQEIVSGWDRFPVNETEVSAAFTDSVGEYLKSSFPRIEGAFVLEVQNWTGGLFYIERKTEDLVPPDSTHTSTLSVDNATMEYQDIPPASSEAIGERTVSPYYVAVGNFSASVSADGLALSRDCGFERPIISALPFLESKLRTFESSSAGEFSDLGKLVQYMLSTLAQLRVLQGYGQPMYMSGLSSADILTEQDVYRAVAVGLLMEQSRLFRSIDAKFAEKVSEVCGGGYPGNLALAASRGRGLDPAELFLWYLGVTELDIDPSAIVSEAIFGIMDQYSIKLMEYMGWLGVIDAVESFGDFLGSTVDSVLERLTGEDRAAESVAAWLSKTIDAGGSDAEDFSSMFSMSPDYSVYVPERVYYVQDAAGNLYPVWVGNLSVPVEIPEYDLFSSAKWAEFYPSFKECQTDFRELTTDSLMRLAFDLSQVVSLEIDGLVVDPTDKKDLFSSIAGSLGRADLMADSDAVARIGKDLPLLSVHYDLAQRFAEFLSTRWIEIVDREGLMQLAYSGIASWILATARYPYIPDLVVPVEQQLGDIIRSDVAKDDVWAVGSSAAVSLDDISSVYMEVLSIAVSSSVTKSDDGFSGPIVDAFARLLVKGADSFPGLEQIVEAQLTHFVRAMVSQGDFAGHKRSVWLDSDGEYELWEGEKADAHASGRLTTEKLSVSVPSGLPEMRAVPFDPAVGYESLERLFPTDDLLVQVQRPWEFDRSREEYPNTHLTAMDEFSPTPYTTQWTVSALGVIRLLVCSGNSVPSPFLLSEPIHAESLVRVEFSLPIVIESAWPLDGVAYNPSDTALTDFLSLAHRFLSVVWDKIQPVVGWLKDGFEALYRFFEPIFETISSFATRVVKAISLAMQVMVDKLQEYIHKIADSALAKALKVFLDLTGRAELRLTIHGFTIIVQTYLPDLIYRQGSDLLRVIVCTDRFGPGLAFGVRFARLSDGSYDILVNGTVKLKSVTVDVAVDPFMFIKRRFVEAHAQAKSWALDLVMPDVEPYELAEASTADIPGLGAVLSNIPLPALGLSASVEAGIAVKYSPPFPTDVVVNEFESNPYGEDDGREWVELYNPLAQPKCIDGWKLATVHGQSAALGLKGTIPGNGLLVFVFPEVSIDNGIPGDPFNDGDAIVLTDASGETIDVTPVLKDTSNDGRTNQRSWDGGGNWAFREGSMGASNGVPVILATSDFVAKAVFEAFREAFAQTSLSEVHASLDFVVLFSKRVLNNLIENLISLIGEIVHEVVFYLEVVLSEATGSAGVGFRTSFVVTGDAIVDLVRWLIHTFATFVVNLGRPSCPLAYPAFPQEFFSGLYVSFEVFFKVGTPKMLRLLGAVGPLDQEFRCVVAISPNIPAIGKLVGRSWGNWSVEFGAYLEGVPRRFAADFLAKDTGDMIDFWLVRARVYGT